MGLMMKELQTTMNSPLTSSKPGTEGRKLEEGKFGLYDLDPLDVAQQLTAIEFGMWRF
jgi:hypothetical protein